MTNNNLQDQLMEFWDTYKDKVGLGKFSDELTRFVQELLTKKDQEHKAELEMIKGEIRDSGFSICSAHQKYDKDCFICKSSNVRTEDAISILDSHINKLSTE